MAEGEGRNEGEDLFEDLDKFFAPIQDVDWPETEQPRAPGPSTPQPARAEGEEDSPETREDTAAFEAPLRIETDEDDEDLIDEGAAEAGPEPTPGQEDLFGDDTAPAPISVWAAGSSGPGGEEDVTAGGEAPGSVEEEEGDLSDEAITEEAFAQAPSAYVDLPGVAEEPEETRVAELLEEGTEPEVRPDLDEVEAAADHFAESVREEVRVEPSPGGPVETEEVEIASLLGDEVEEAEEVEPARAVRVGPEGLGGPSWQEPTALEVGAESERRGPGRDVPMAFLTGLVLAALALGAIAIGAGPFALLAGVIVLFAQGEFYFALQRRHYQPATALGLVTGALVLAAGYFRNEAAMLAVASLGTFATFLWYMTVPIQHRRNVVSNIALTILGVLYVPVLAGYALAVLKLPDGRGLALSIIGLTIVYDVSAFGVGYFWGSRPLAPNVSPKKSWEGAIGATLVVIAVAVGAVAPAVSILDTVGRSVGLAVVVAIFAPLGDLAESLLKRDLGLKDMGSVLPGHGGVLDRIDAVLFVAPAAFMFLRLILL